MFGDFNNIKWVVSIAISLVFVLQSGDIVLTGDPEIKKFLLIEVAGILGVLVGYYWGSSKDANDGTKSKE